MGSFSDPKKNINKLNLKLGDTVADFGAGSGHYSMVLSEQVGESGRVYAVDIQKDLLSKIMNTAKAERKNNLELVWADLETKDGTHLQSNLVDAIVISNLLFQVKNKEAVIKEAERILKGAGKVLVVDWSGTTSGVGPTQEMLFTKDNAKKMFSNLGFELVEEIDAGQFHWGIIFRKK